MAQIALSFQKGAIPDTQTAPALRMMYRLAPCTLERVPACSLRPITPTFIVCLVALAPLIRPCTSAAHTQLAPRHAGSLPPASFPVQNAQARKGLASAFPEEGGGGWRIDEPLPACPCPNPRDGGPATHPPQFVSGLGASQWLDGCHILFMNHTLPCTDPESGEPRHARPPYHAAWAS